MSIDLAEATITDAVQRTFDGCDDPRSRELFVALVGHLHDVARPIPTASEPTGRDPVCNLSFASARSQPGGGRLET